MATAAGQALYITAEDGRIYPNPNILLVHGYVINHEGGRSLLVAGEFCPMGNSMWRSRVVAAILSHSVTPYMVPSLGKPNMIKDMVGVSSAVVVFASCDDEARFKNYDNWAVLTLMRALGIKYVAKVQATSNVATFHNSCHLDVFSERELLERQRQKQITDIMCILERILCAPDVICNVQLSYETPRDYISALSLHKDEPEPTLLLAKNTAADRTHLVSLEKRLACIPPLLDYLADLGHEVTDIAQILVYGYISIVRRRCPEDQWKSRPMPDMPPGFSLGFMIDAHRRLYTSADSDGPHRSSITAALSYFYGV